MLNFKSALIATVALFAAGGAYAETTVHQIDISSAVPHCDAPVATILVGQFACKASGCSAPAAGPAAGLLAMAKMAQGDQIVDMTNLGAGTTNAMVTALNATGCFKVQEREALESLRKEAELSGIEFKPAPADYLIMGAITSVNLSAKSNNVAGGLIPVVGAFQNTKKKADMTIDVRVVKVSTSEIVATQTFEVSSERSNWSFGAAGYSNGLMMGGASSTKSPEIDSVANQVVLDASGYLANKIAGPAVTVQAQPPVTKK